ncbi:MAG: AraC family transcriptional regulator [Clostridia bacterium]|nr:AraC family transcriptional regulator [Clostridia bacterium]
MVDINRTSLNKGVTNRSLLVLLSGEVICGGKKVKSGEMLFFENEKIENTTNNISKAAVIEFCSDDKFPIEVLRLKKQEKDIIFAILEENREYSEQMRNLLFSVLLIRVKRGDVALAKDDGNEILSNILAFMEDNIGRKITLDDISHFAGVSKTTVKKLFKDEIGFGACEYFTKMKIERAKELIEEERNNFTQIAELLGYDSIHYFSRQFKQYTGMSPTEFLSMSKGE